MVSKSLAKSVSQSNRDSVAHVGIDISSQQVNQSVSESISCIRGVKSVKQSDKYTVKQADRRTDRQTSGSRSLSVSVNQSISEEVNTPSDR